MADLTSIDLTQGRRLEKASTEDDRQFIASVIDFRESQLHRRLSGGEIPHSVRSSDSGITITTINHLNDWVAESTIDLDNTVIHWNSGGWSNRWSNITTTTTQSFSIDDEFVDTSNIVNNIWISHVGDSYTWYTPSAQVKSIADYGISKRLEYDPFTLYEDASNFETIERLSRADYEHDHDNGRVLKRLYQDGMDDGNYDDAVLDILEYAEREDSKSDVEDTIFGVFRSYDLSDDAKLKHQAPFINRIYRTNRGMSFDDTELRFDLVLAQEHFNEVLNNLGRN